jgi:hypothetical protein
MGSSTRFTSTHRSAVMHEAVAESGDPKNWNSSVEIWPRTTHMTRASFGLSGVPNRWYAGSIVKKDRNPYVHESCTAVVAEHALSNTKSQAMTTAALTATYAVRCENRFDVSANRVSSGTSSALVIVINAVARIS